MGYQVKAYLTLFGTCLIQFVAGSAFLYGDLSVYVLSYFYSIDQNTPLDITNYVLLGMTIATITGVLTSVKITLLFGSRFSLAIGVLVTPATYLAASYTQNFYLFSFFFGFVAGYASAVMYVQGLGVVWVWFKDIKNVITGIVMAFFAGSVLVFAWAAGKLTNPMNEPATIKIVDGHQVYYLFSRDIIVHFPMTLRILAAAFFVIGVLGLLMISAPENESVPSSQPSSPEKNKAPASEGSTKFYLEPAFWMLWVMAMLGATTAYFSSFQYKSYGLTIINDDDFMSLLGSLTGFANMMARLFWGFTLKSMTFPVSISLILIMSAGGIISLYWIREKLLYTVAFMVMQFAAGGVFTVFAPELMRRWGLTQGALVFSVFTTANQSAILMNVLIGIFGLNNFGYDICFIVMAVGCLLAIFVGLILFLFNDKPDEKIRSSLGTPSVHSERLPTQENKSVSSSSLGGSSLPEGSSESGSPPRQKARTEEENDADKQEPLIPSKTD